MTSETTAQRQVQKLQRAIVDGLEDVKAQDIQVFNSETLSPLFERVIIASGTSNRQTKALASSVRDAVREAGFAKPRVEGEENGEWIIVDCGPAVVHIMQPAIRQYYHLEELWGEKPVHVRLGATAKKGVAKARGQTQSRKVADTPVAPAMPAKASKPATARRTTASASSSRTAQPGRTTAAVGRNPPAKKASRPATTQARPARAAGAASARKAVKTPASR